MKLTMVPLTMLLTRPMTPRSRYEIEYNWSRPSLKYLNQKYYEINALTYITNVLRKDFRCVFYLLSNIFLLHFIKPFSFIDWLSKQPLKHLKKNSIQKQIRIIIWHLSMCNEYAVYSLITNDYFVWIHKNEIKEIFILKKHTVPLAQQKQKDLM